MTDSVSNFYLVCYYDNKTNELVRIEQYNDNDTSVHSDIESYKYGYNAEIIKPEQLIKQLRIQVQECDQLKQALQEIKDYCNKYPQNSIGFKKQILQKCEVLKDVK